MSKQNSNVQISNHNRRFPSKVGQKPFIEGNNSPQSKGELDLFDNDFKRFDIGDDEHIDFPAIVNSLMNRSAYKNLNDGEGADSDEIKKGLEELIVLEPSDGVGKREVSVAINGRMDIPWDLKPWEVEGVMIGGIFTEKDDFISLVKGSIVNSYGESVYYQMTTLDTIGQTFEIMGDVLGYGLALGILIAVITKRRRDKKKKEERIAKNTAYNDKLDKEAEERRTKKAEEDAEDLQKENEAKEKEEEERLLKEENERKEKLAKETAKKAKANEKELRTLRGQVQRVTDERAIMELSREQPGDDELSVWVRILAYLNFRD